MAVPPRFFENNSYYHIYNRGNRKQRIFLQDKDYTRFLEKIVTYKNKYPLKIVAYCLMPNHFHLLIQQSATNSISRFFSDLCNSHSTYFNMKYETVGSLYQGRFKSKLVEQDEYLVHLSRYIHLNPYGLYKHSGKNARDLLLRYKWSSLSAYLSGEANDIVDPETVLSYFTKKNSVSEYEKFVMSNIDIPIDPLSQHLAFDE